MSGHWLIYVRRSYKKLGTDRIAASADTSDETQLERCLALLPAGATHDVISDSGGHQSGRSEKRLGWLEVLRRVEQGGVAGVAAYDLARLARNARLVLNLHHALERTGADLRVAQMPGTDFTSAQGRLLLGMMAVTSQLEADYASQRMRDMMRATFEAGAHRGNDPFGYRTKRDEAGRVLHPRTLEIIEEEALVVRRVFDLLARLPFSEVADVLNREGVCHRAPRAWTVNSIKDLWRRGPVYRGNVMTRRGAEVRPGRHEAILTEEQFRRASAGVQSRLRHTGKEPRSAKRTYLLRGLVCCSCGTKMHGTGTLSRGQLWRYYICPVAERKRAVLGPDGELIVCHARRVPAVVAERFVISRLRELMNTDERIAAARQELAARLRAPQPGTVDRQRERLETSLRRLAELYRWQDIEESDYHRQVREVRAQLAELPRSDGKLVAFDDYRRRAAEMRSFAEMVDAASGDKLQELIPWLIERVETNDRRVVRVVPTEPARPFFAWADQDACVGVAPPDGFEPPTQALGRPRSIH